MKVTWFVAILSATAYAAPEAGQSDTDADAGYSPNWAAFGEVVQSLMALPTKNLNLDNIAAPDHSLIGQIIQNVPPTAMVQLAVPSQRSELASAFSAGTTPDWYQSLPTDVRRYISVVKSQIAAGALTAAPTPTAAGVTQSPMHVTSGTGTGGGVGTASAGEESMGAATSTTSEGKGARVTGAVVSGMGMGMGMGMGALGVLGLAVGL